MARIAKIPTFIEWIDGDETNKHFFEVGIVLSGKLFIDENGKNIANALYDSTGDVPILVFDKTDNEVISHECLHATIDFFRIKNISFNLLFLSDDNEGEEIFVECFIKIISEVKRCIKILKSGDKGE